jgi:hypothetical protein
MANLKEQYDFEPDKDEIEKLLEDMQKQTQEQIDLLMLEHKLTTIFSGLSETQKKKVIAFAESLRGDVR